DYAVPIEEMGSLLVNLLKEPIKEKPELTPQEIKRLSTEIKIANQENAFDMGILEIGKLMPLTCPECHGALVNIKEGKIMRYRCHTGHSFTASSLLAEVSKSVEESLWNAIRGLEETVMILEEIGKNLSEDGKSNGGQEFFEKAEE